MTLALLLTAALGASADIHRAFVVPADYTHVVAWSKANRDVLASAMGFRIVSRTAEGRVRMVARKRGEYVDITAAQTWTEGLTTGGVRAAEYTSRMLSCATRNVAATSVELTLAEVQGGTLVSIHVSVSAPRAPRGMLVTGIEEALDRFSNTMRKGCQ